jgi:hypothetical protein
MVVRTIAFVAVVNVVVGMLIVDTTGMRFARTLVKTAVELEESTVVVTLAVAEASAVTAVVVVFPALTVAVAPSDTGTLVEVVMPGSVEVVGVLAMLLFVEIHMVVIMSVIVRLIVVGIAMGTRMVAVVERMLSERVGRVVSTETLMLAVTATSGVVVLIETLGETVGINFCVTVATSVWTTASRVFTATSMSVAMSTSVPTKVTTGILVPVITERMVLVKTRGSAGRVNVVVRVDATAAGLVAWRLQAEERMALGKRVRGVGVEETVAARLLAYW